MAFGGYLAKSVLWQTGSHACQPSYTLSSTAMWTNWFLFWFCRFVPMCPLHISLFILIVKQKWWHSGKQFNWAFESVDLWQPSAFLICCAHLLLNVSYRKVTLSLSSCEMFRMALQTTRSLWFIHQCMLLLTWKIGTSTWAQISFLHFLIILISSSSVVIILLLSRYRILLIF